MARWVSLSACKQAFASIDIHNNTGSIRITPASRARSSVYCLARSFPDVVHFERPLGVHSRRVRGLCLRSQWSAARRRWQGRDARVELIEACLSMAQLPSADSCLTMSTVSHLRDRKSAGSCEFLRWVSSRFPLSIRHRSAEFQRTWRRRVAWQDCDNGARLMVLRARGTIATYISIMRRDIRLTQDAIPRC